MSRLREWFDLVADLPAEARAAALRDAGADEAAVAEVLELFELENHTHTRARAPLASLAAQLVATELRSGDVLGVWRLGREIGHGGMGAVFLAERADGHYRQQAAIKLMRGRRDAEAAARFAHERQLLAQLQHPQIARLIDGGSTPGGQPWLAMEYVDGVSIDQWCRGKALGLEARLQLFRSICGAVQYAHRHLVAHCDLKPSNVLVRGDGVPVLLDFGIARALGSDAPAAGPSDGSEGSTPMTPRYASPEQRRGEPPGLATDIHALGLMLFELATDTPPPRERDGDAPPCPSRAAPPSLPWRRRLRGDLDAIVAQACAAEPSARYASAAALAEDVARIAQHRPLQARRATLPYLTARLLRRRWPAFVAGALVLALAAGFTWRTLQAERRARIEADTAQRATDFMVSVFAAADSNVNTGLKRELTAREVLDAGRARIDTELADQPAVRARLLEALGHAYRHMNRGDTAVPLLREAAELNLHPSVDDPLAAARCLEALTNAMANGEFRARETLDVARRSLDLSMRVAPAGSQQVANAWMVYTLAAYRNLEFDDALHAARTSLAMNEALGGPDVRRPQAHNNLGMVLTEMGRHSEAREQIDRALALSLPDTMGEALRQRRGAIVRQRLGEWEAAETMWRAALRTAAAMHGDHDAFAVSFRGGLAALMFELARYHEALALLERARNDQLALGGADSAELLVLRQIEAIGRMRAGEPAAAAATLAEVHARRAQLFGADDPRAMDTALAWSEAQLRAGDSGAEVTARLDALQAFWNGHNARGAHPARTLALVRAHWHLLRREPAAALALLDEVEREPGQPDVNQRVRAASLRAWAVRLGDDHTATRLAARNHFALHRQLYGDAHPGTALAALMLARTLHRLGDTAEAGQLEAQWQDGLRRFPEESAFRDALPEG